MELIVVDRPASRHSRPYAIVFDADVQDDDLLRVAEYWKFALCVAIRN
jgi:hypothetical protein